MLKLKNLIDKNKHPILCCISIILVIWLICIITPLIVFIILYIVLNVTHTEATLQTFIKLGTFLFSIFLLWGLCIKLSPLSCAKYFTR